MNYFLITQKNLPQKTEAINKKDILNPMTPNYKTICLFEGMDKNRDKILLDFSKVEKAHGAYCKINPKYLEDLNFKQIKNIEANLSEYLKTREQETVKDFIIWQKI